MIELFSKERMILNEFFIPREEVCVWSCLEGIMGRAWINDKSYPLYGVVAVADFLFLLGHAPKDLSKELINLIGTFGRNQIIVFYSTDWENVILKEFPDNNTPFKRYSFYWEPEVFNRTLLEKYTHTEDIPYEIVPFTLEIAELSLQNNFTADFCMFYESLDSFIENGIGFCMIHNNEIVTGASSYSTCNGAIDITIGTIKEYRRKGLALKCAAKLILECLERGIYPRWDAANLESVELAKKLGYRFKEEYQVYTIK